METKILLSKGLHGLFVIVYDRGMSATTELIVALRYVAKLSQSEISRRTGIPQPRISRWQAGAPDSADDVLKLHALHAELIPGVGRRKKIAALVR